MVSINHFVPPNLKREFYHGAKGHERTRHNGLDPYGFSTNGLVAYLPLWALQNNVAFKSVDAYKHTCTNTNSTWQPDGRLFAGTGYLNLGDLDQFDFTDGAGTDRAFTIQTWVNFSDATDGCLIAKSNGVRGWSAYTAGDALYVRLRDGDNDWIGRATGNLTAYEGSWKFITIHYTGGGAKENISIYEGASTQIDIGDDEFGAYGGLTVVADNVEIGSYAGGGTRNLNATMGEMLVYSRNISAGERAHNYNSTRWRYQ